MYLNVLITTKTKTFIQGGSLKKKSNGNNGVDGSDDFDLDEEEIVF